MKTHLNHLMIIAFLFVAVFQSYAQGYIVPNGVAQGSFGNAIGFTVIQDPSDGDFTGFFLSPEGGNTFSPLVLADEGVRVFFVSPNDPISLQPILSQNYSEFLGPTVIANGAPFYLGLFTGNTFPVNGIYSDPLFGWARLVNNNGVIQVLNSALEYGGGGIFAGTQNIIPVPEPGFLALVSIGALVGWRYRRRQFP